MISGSCQWASRQSRRLPPITPARSLQGLASPGNSQTAQHGHRCATIGARQSSLRNPTTRKGETMTFEEVLDQAIAMLQRRGRLTYRTLQLQFQLDEAHLEALKDELIYGQRLAVDEEGRVLVWTGDAASPPAPAVPPPPERPPQAYTPAYLAEKILSSRTALEGERKQVTVLFADLKGSMELLADRDPEEARQLL